MGKALMLAFALASPAHADEVTIAALGDSLTQGYGLVQEEGFVPQLQGWLAARGQQVALINAGVSGDTTAGGLSRIDWTLTPDVDALIVALGGNDLLRGLPPEASRANLEGILQAAAKAGVPVLLVGMEAPGNYGPEFKAAFDAIYPDLAAQYGALHADSFLGPLTAAAEADPRAALASYMQADGIHPNAAGVALIVEALGPLVESLIAQVPQS
jgi:acyl-CoA thioesterase-1